MASVENTEISVKLEVAGKDGPLTRKVEAKIPIVLLQAMENIEKYMGGHEFAPLVEGLVSEEFRGALGDTLNKFKHSEKREVAYAFKSIARSFWMISETMGNYYSGAEDHLKKTWIGLIKKERNTIERVLRFLEKQMP